MSHLCFLCDDKKWDEVQAILDSESISNEKNEKSFAIKDQIMNILPVLLSGGLHQWKGKEKDRFLQHLFENK